MKGFKSKFSEVKISLLFFSVISLIVLTASALVFLKVQNRTQQKNMLENAYSLATELADQRSPEAMKKSGVRKFFILNVSKVFKNKLTSFSFAYGFDADFPQKTFSGHLKGDSFKHIHDLASDAVIKQGPISDISDINGGNVIFAFPLTNGQVAVMVKKAATPYPPAPWEVVLIALFVGFVLVFINFKYSMPVSLLFVTFLVGMAVSGFRLVPEGSVLQILKYAGAGFSVGIFPWVWFLLIVFVFLLGVLWEYGKILRFYMIIKENKIAYTYILPAIAGMSVLVLIPFAIGLGLGFFNHCKGDFQFVGLRNFIEILSGGGASITNPLNFYFTLGVTLLWTALNVFLHVSIGLGLALLLKDPLLKFKGIYRVLLIIPWAMPNYITALMWKGMFQQQYGAVNIILEKLGIGGISWFSSFWPAFMANVITNTWLGFPFMMVVALGALQSIPASLYEAAKVDGASKWQQFRHITLPLLKPALYPAIILGSIWTFNMFNVIYLVSGGEPGGSTDILITEAYQWAFKRGERYGLAAAYAVLIFIILLIYSRVANKLSKAGEEI